MPSAARYRLSLSADRHRAPDEIRLLHTGIKAKLVNKGKGKQNNTNRREEELEKYKRIVWHSGRDFSLV